MAVGVLGPVAAWRFDLLARRRADWRDVTSERPRAPGGAVYRVTVDLIASFAASGIIALMVLTAGSLIARTETPLTVASPVPPGLMAKVLDDGRGSGSVLASSSSVEFSDEHSVTREPIDASATPASSKVP